MRFGLFRASRNRALLLQLHEQIIGAARQPAFYIDYGVADTFEGRFEMAVLHLSLVLRRLARSPEPGPSIAGDLSDLSFQHFDVALRELGVGDISIPKKMKRLTEAYFGRATAYEAALAGSPDLLEKALLRNALAGSGDGARLARYARALEARLTAAALDELIDKPLPFPDAAEVS